eukprot:c18312_g1_i2 orf=437-1291(+)
MIMQAYRSAIFSGFGILQFTKSAFLEHAKKFKAEDMQVDLTGKNCIVTGSNSGIGFETAKALASRGATVYMVCRNKDKAEKALQTIKSVTGNDSIHLEICDLSSVQQIRRFTSNFMSLNIPLHVLVNNAGLLENEHITTDDGLEMNFAVNVAGVYSMTELLLPVLEKASPDSRVITVSSGGMYTKPLTDDLQFSKKKFSGVDQYAQNKRLQVALTEKWAELYRSRGIGFYSMHPGWADTPGVATSLPTFRMFQTASLILGASTLIVLKQGSILQDLAPHTHWIK